MRAQLSKQLVIVFAFSVVAGKTSYLLPFSTERQNHLTNCFFNVDYFLGVLEARPDSFLDEL
jgi:hypothetical protein